MNQIRLAVKCTPRPPDLKRFIRIARHFGLSGLEVCELPEVMVEIPQEKRVQNIAAAARGVISHLCFHEPLWEGPLESVRMADLASLNNYGAIKLAKETISDAVETGIAFGGENEVLVNMHVIGYASPEEVNVEGKLACLRRGERVLQMLRDYARELCEKKGFVRAGRPMALIVRENNPPTHYLGVQSMIDFHPSEFASLDLAANLDFAHLQLYLNYLAAKKPKIRSLGPRSTARSILLRAGTTSSIRYGAVFVSCT